MGQGGANKSKKKKAIKSSYIDYYNKQKPEQKRLVSLFWLGLKTENEEGLKSGEDILPGGVDNYGDAGNLKTYFTTKQFRYQADVSCIVCCFVFVLRRSFSVPSCLLYTNNKQQHFFI